jgi:putative ABC transport system ATP-binding protein
VSQAEVLDLLARLRRERGLTLVMVTHSAEVAAAADRVIRLRDGQIVTG